MDLWVLQAEIAILTVVLLWSIVIRSQASRSQGGGKVGTVVPTSRWNEVTQDWEVVQQPITHRASERIPRRPDGVMDQSEADRARDAAGLVAPDGEYIADPLYRE